MTTSAIKKLYTPGRSFWSHMKGRQEFFQNYYYFYNILLNLKELHNVSLGK